MSTAEVLTLERPDHEQEPGHRDAVVRVIEAMSDRLEERFSLDSLAALAFFSPYHFHRLFRQVTGVPPGRFFGALRIEAAKRLLLTSDLSVTQVCLAVGYQSLGTFTSQFTRLVGISPRRLREIARSEGWTELVELPVTPSVDPAAQTALVGHLDLPAGAGDAFAAVGLFRTRLAEGRPAGCALVPAPGEYQLAAVEAGPFYVLAVSIEACGCWNDLLLEGAEVHVAATATPVLVQPGSPVRVDLALRARRVTDPPILLAPALLLGATAGAGPDRRRVPA
jgi:AraC family transcriptional regulator